MAEDGFCNLSTSMYFGSLWEVISLTVDSQDYYLKHVADSCSLAVVSIGYRLAPESPFPAGPEDCYDAASYLIKHGQTKFGGGLKFISGEVSYR